MKTPDVVVLSAPVVMTMAGPDATAVALHAGRIAAVGDRATLLQIWPSAAEVSVDGVVMPGFHDAHMHFSFAVHHEHEIDAGPESCPTIATLLHAVEVRASGSRSEDWVLASGYDDSAKRIAGSTLDRAALDGAAPSHAVLVKHISSHWAVANSEALRRGGYLNELADPPGGTIGRDAAGNANGYLYETALFNLALPDLDATEWERCARIVNRRFHMAGITSASDAWVFPADIRHLVEAERSGTLTLRVAMLVDHREFDPALHIRPISERLTYSGVKWFADGAIGGRTARLDEPYKGTRELGIEVTTRAESTEIARRVVEADARVAIHANGDWAIRELLGALESVARNLGPLRRPRIEHCSVIDDEIAHRLRALGAVVLPFASYTRMYGGRLTGWYGDERAERMFAVRRFLDAGIPVAASTDHPVAPFEPLNAIQAMVTRRGKSDNIVVGGSQCVSTAEALAIYTRGSAYAEESELSRGRLAPGFHADLVILEKDPRQVDPHSLASIRVAATVVGGQAVWSAPGVDLDRLDVPRSHVRS